jgi:hypothetical protein
MNPYISIVIITRNDIYAGSMKDKLIIGLNDLFVKLSKCKFSIEIIIVEWNPPENMPTINNYLMDIEIPQNIELKIIKVPNSIHIRYHGHEKKALISEVAMNVGIRRSRGEFIVYKAVDSFYSNKLIDFLSKKELESNIFYRVARYDVKIDIFKNEINSINLESNIIDSYEWNGRGLFTSAPGDFIMMHRSAWFRIRGFPESSAAVLLGSDNEVVFAAIGIGLKQVVLQDGIKVYKIWHSGLFSTRVKSVNYDSSSVKKIIEKMPLVSRSIITQFAIIIRILILGVLNLPHTTMTGVKTRSFFRLEMICYLRQIMHGGAFFYSNRWGLKSDQLNEETIKK